MPHSLGRWSGEWGWVLEIPPILTVNQTFREVIIGMHAFTIMLFQEVCNSYLLLATISHQFYFTRIIKKKVLKLVLKFS